MAYIVMDAPGCYGTYAEVHSRHDDLRAACAAAGKFRGRAIVSTDGGFAENHQPGSLIHREFAQRYEIVWSIDKAQAARQAGREAQEREKWHKEYVAASKELGDRYGVGSQQHMAALDHWVRTHGGITGE